MPIQLQEDYFSTEEEAIAEAKAIGRHTLTVDFPATKSEVHWHDFDAEVYVLDGTAQVTDVDAGITYSCGKGAKLSAPARTLHSENHEPYRAVVALSVDPGRLTPPIDLPPEQLKR